MEQNIYLQKYLKYKTKYLNLKNSNNELYIDLKNNVQVGGAYDDLKWVRGTNTSIFLSCYKEPDGKYYLMSKGTQFKNGFVPMSETVDPGILSMRGVNWNSISGYPHNKITESGVYATSKLDFNIDSTKDVLEESLSKKCGIIFTFIMFMRLKQYYGMDHPIISDIKDKITKSGCDEIMTSEFRKTIDYQNKILQLIAFDIRPYLHLVKYDDDGKIKLISLDELRNNITDQI